MIQNRIGRKFSVGIWDVPMNQSALTKFFRILGISTVWPTIFLSNVKFRVVEKDTLYTNLQSFQRQVKSKHCCFFEQHMKYL